MFRTGCYRAPETGAGSAPASLPAPAAKITAPRSGFSIGFRIVVLVVIGIAMIVGLALVGESRLSSVAADSREQRQAIESDRAEIDQTLAALRRAETTSAGYLAAFGRAGDAILAGRSTSAAADLAERALTDFAQSLRPLDAANRSFAVSLAKSAHLQPWDESVDNQQETAFIAAARDRIQAMLKITQDLPAGLASVVLDNQATTANIRSGNIADAREIFRSRQASRVAAFDQSLQSLDTALVDFGQALAERHTSLLRATDAEAEDRYDSLYSSFRLQFILLTLVLCAGAVLIAIHGLAIPLADLTAAASRLADGHFEEPATVLGRRDEIGRLSRALERIRETVWAARQSDEQQNSQDREAREAERLERNTMEREIQALRKDRERLEKELAAQAQSQVSLEALEQVRTDAQTQMQAAEAQHKQALDAAHAEIARLKADLEQKPDIDPATQEALTKAEAEIARLKIQAEHQSTNAIADTKKHQAAIAQAQSEIHRLIDEIQALRTAQGGGSALAEAEAEIARLKEQVERQGASNVAREMRHQNSIDQAEAEIARLRNEQMRDRKAAADAQAEREHLAHAAQATAAKQEKLRALTSALALEKQRHEDELAELRAVHARETAEIENRLAEQQADRVRVVNELINGFETSIANAVATVQTASHDLVAASSRIGENTEHTGRQRTEISARAARASTSIHSAAVAVEQLSTAFDDLTQQLGQSVNAAGGANASARVVIEAVQTLEAAAGRMKDADIAITDLAERTNMLSLNASIEAAKAGDAGKGFVLVAAEIKSLANRTQRTGKELSERINAVNAAAGSVRSAFAGVNTLLGELDTLTAKAARLVAQQGISARGIVANVHSAAEGTDSVNRAVDETTQTAEVSARIVAMAQSAARALDIQAQALRREIDELLAAIRSA